MRLTINIRAPEAESLLVTVGGQTQRSDEDSRRLTFDLPSGDYTVELRQETEEFDFSIGKLLMFLLFMVFWGILNILLLNVDTDWWKDCKTFCLKVQTDIHLQQDEELSFRFVNTKYEESRQSWRMPEYQMEPELPVREMPQPNPASLPNGYLSFLFQLISVYAVLAVIMLLLLYATLSNGILWGAVLSLTILTVCGAVVVGVAVYHYRKLRKLQKDFSTQQHFSVEKDANRF